MRFRRNLSLGDATMLQVLEMPLMNFWQVYYSGLEMRWTSLVLAKIAVTLSDQFPSGCWMLIQESNQCVCVVVVVNLNLFWLKCALVCSQNHHVCLQFVNYSEVCWLNW